MASSACANCSGERSSSVIPSGRDAAMRPPFRARGRSERPRQVRIAGNVVFATRCPQRTHAGTLTAVQLREVGPGSPDPHLATDSRCVRSADSATPCHPWCEVSRTSTPASVSSFSSGNRRFQPLRRFRAHEEFRAIAPPSNEPRINDRIRAREVRLVGQDGEQIGIKPLPEALNIARAAGLDLVEVADRANPPVCRIMDYGKFKYEADQR